MAKNNSAADRRHMNKVAESGCVLCSYLGYGHTRAEIHHLRHGMGMGQRNNNQMIIPLCFEHHRGNTGYHGLGRRAFERMYEITELELLALSQQNIGLPGTAEMKKAASRAA